MEAKAEPCAASVHTSGFTNAGVFASKSIGTGSINLVEVTAEIDSSLNPIPTEVYQLDLTTPGSKPSCAHSRNTLRDSPKSR
jgi:hypothetical protein